MPLERVWSRFESKRKDGTVLKLKIQDIPKAHIDNAIELMLKYFVKEEPVHKATGIHEDPESLARYKTFLVDLLRDLSYSIVICCADEDYVKDIMGVSLMCLTDGTDGILEKIAETIEKDGTLPLKKMNRIFKECADAFDPIKEYNLNKFYADRDLLVVPRWRGLGVAKQLFKVRRLVCKAHGVPMTGAWMTAYGTQTAAARDGWETVKELSYDYLGDKYGVTFTDVPRTIKFMISKASNSETIES